MIDPLSDSMRRLTNRNQTALLRGMASVTQKRVAELIGVSEGTLSDMKRDQLLRFSSLVAAAGLQLVPLTAQYHDEEFISALKTLAAHGLGRVGNQERGGDDE